MRLRASLSGLLIMTVGACAQIPDDMLVQVGDRSVELKKKAAAQAATVTEPAAPEADQPAEAQPDAADAEPR